MNEFVDRLPKNSPIAFVIGAVAVGNPGYIKKIFFILTKKTIAIEIDYIEDSICVSKYGLSASYCLGRILNSFENSWDIN